MKNRLKQLFTMVLAAALLFTGTPMGVFAADDLPDGESSTDLTASGTWGNNLTWTLDETGKLTLSGTGGMEYPYYGSEKLDQIVKHIEIQSGITSICAHAFMSWTELTDVTIPGSVTEIGQFAFAECGNLTNVSMEKGVSLIGDRAFQGCISLKGITIPDTEGGVSIGGYAFSHCTNMNYADLGSSVNEICAYAFSECGSLTSIYMGKAATIHEGAFSDCSSLRGITIPDSKDDIGYGIEDYAFVGCSNMKYINLGNGVTVISHAAFSGCSGVMGLEIPDSVYEIETDAFDQCNGLTYVNIGDGVTRIDEYAFTSCYGLTSIRIGKSLTSIDQYAFTACRNLKSMTIPINVTNISSAMFGFVDTPLLSDIYYEGTEDQWQSVAGWNTLPGNPKIHFGVTCPAQTVTVVYQDGWQILHVIDEDGMTVEGADVTWEDDEGEHAEKTDANGNVRLSFVGEFTDGEDGGEPALMASKTKDVTIAKDGYASDTFTVGSEKNENAVLSKEDSGLFKLSSAKASLTVYNLDGRKKSGKNKNILTDSFSINVRPISVSEKELDFLSIECSVPSKKGLNKKVTSYSLYQEINGRENLIIQEDPSAINRKGYFNSVLLSELTPGGSFFIRVEGTDAAGKAIHTDTPIQLITCDYSVPEELNLSSTFRTEMKKLVIKIPDEAPFLGGKTISIPLPDKIPIFAWKADDKIRLGVGIPENEAKENAEKILKTLSSLTDYKNNKNSSGDGKSLSKSELKKADSLIKSNGLKTGGTGGILSAPWIPDISVVGYGEMPYGSKTVNLVFAVILNWSAKKEWGGTVFYIPTTGYVELEGELGIQNTFAYSDYTSSFGNRLKLNPNVSMKAFEGVGIPIVRLGIYGKTSTDLSLTVPTQSSEDNITIEGDLGLEAYALGKKTEKQIFKGKKTWYFNNSSAKLLDSGGFGAYNLDASMFTDEDLSYLSAESGWLDSGVYLMDAEASVALTPLLTGTYRDACPVLISSGDALYAAFVRADRESGQRSIALTKFDGKSWHNPVTVDSNAVLDGDPCLFYDGETLRLAYTKTREKAQDDSLLSLAKQQSIVVGTIDPDTLTFTEEETYDGEGFACVPRLAATGGGCALVWLDSALTDEENSVLMPETTQIRRALHSANGWDEAETLLTVEGSVSSIAAGEIDGTLSTAYIVDHEGQRNLYCSTADDSSKLLQEDVIGVVRYAVLSGESGGDFVWNDDNCLKSASGEVIPATGINGEYAITGENLYYSAKDGDATQLTMVRRTESDGWTLPISLAGGERYLENLSAARCGNQDYIFGMNTAAEIKEESVTTDKDLVWARIVPVSDLRIDGVDFDSAALRSGDEVAVTLTLTNAGDHTVKQIDLSVNGETVRTEHCNLTAGESKDLSLTLTCPESRNNFRIVCVETGQDDYTPEDNVYDIRLGDSDLSVQLDFQSIGSSRELVVTVSNEGAGEAEGAIHLCDAKNNDLAMYAFHGLKAGEFFVERIAEADKLIDGENPVIQAIAELEEEESNQSNNTAWISLIVPERSDPDPVPDPITTGFSEVVWKDTDTVSAVYQSADGENPLIIYCAAYEESGKMCAFDSHRVENNPEELSFHIDVPFTKIRLFALDSAFCPLAWYELPAE